MGMVGLLGGETNFACAFSSRLFSDGVVCNTDFVLPEIFAPADRSLRFGLTMAMWVRVSRWSNQKLGGFLQMSNTFHFFGTPSELGAGRLIDLFSGWLPTHLTRQTDNRKQNSCP